MALSGVILDVDGTLVLSNDIHAQAWVEAFSVYGYDIAFEQVRPLIGMGADHIIPQLVPELKGKDATGKQIADRRKELVLTKFSPQIIGGEKFTREPFGKRLSECLQRFQCNIHN